MMSILFKKHFEKMYMEYFIIIHKLWQLLHCIDILWGIVNDLEMI